MTAQLVRGSARRLDLEVDGCRQIAALQAGAVGAPAVLLLPGYTGSKEDFGPVLDPIAAAGYLVTAVDLPGQHESPGLLARPDYTPDALGAIVVEVAAGLGGDVALLGHSFGGLVARAAVIASADSFVSLVLLCSGPGALAGTRRITMDSLERVLAEAGLPGVYAAMQTAALADPAFVAPSRELADFLERRFLGGSPAMLRGMADALRTEPDRLGELAATAARMLVTHGVNDDAWPIADQADMAKRLHARYAQLPDAAHSPAVENPSALIEVLLDFWAG